MAALSLVLALSSNVLAQGQNYTAEITPATGNDTLHLSSDKDITVEAVLKWNEQDQRWDVMNDALWSPSSTDPDGEIDIVLANPAKASCKYKVQYEWYASPVPTVTITSTT